MNTLAAQRIGLIAGAGEIPVYFAKKAQENGLRIVSVAFTDEIDARLKPFVEKNYSIGLAKSGKIFKILEEENIKDILIIGKVEKKMIFKPQLFDLETLKLIMSFRTHQDKTVMLKIIEEIESRGFKVLDQMEYMKELYPEKGMLTAGNLQKRKWRISSLVFPLPATWRIRKSVKPLWLRIKRSLRWKRWKVRIRPLSGVVASVRKDVR